MLKLVYRVDEIIMSMRLNNKKFGFTLSEVMVTLSLIGVLATLTLSTVGSSVQQRARLAEFRTAFAKMEAAMKNITIDEGKVYSCYKIPDNATEDDFGLSINGSPSEKNTECKAFMDAFVKAMGATRKCENNAVTEGCLPGNYPPAPGGNFNVTNSKAYVLDNSMVIISDGTNYMRLFAIDVNGRKGPNKWGQDIFAFSTRVSESVLIGNRTFVKSVSLFPPDNPENYLGGDASKTTEQMMKESAGIRE